MVDSIDVRLDQYMPSTMPRSVYKVQCRDSMSLYCYSAQSELSAMCLFMRYHYNIRTLLLSDVMAVDYLGNRLRFLISYNLYSIIYNIRILYAISIKEFDNVVSVTNVFPCPDWFEREIWDMFGIIFINQLDMRRILTDYGFQWHPLRKDFPLTGYIEVHYDESYKCILSNDVNLIQDFRIWEFEDQWPFHNTDYVPFERSESNI